MLRKRDKTEPFLRRLITGDEKNVNYKNIKGDITNYYWLVNYKTDFQARIDGQQGDAKVTVIMSCYNLANSELYSQQLTSSQQALKAKKNIPYR